MKPGFAPAKINLWLHIGPPRRDSFHPVNSLIAFARDVGDTLSVDPAEDLTLDLTGPEAAALEGQDNLVLEAARLFAKKAHKKRGGAHIALNKVLPVASGMGGGSVDAAAALRLLNTMWELDWPQARLADLAADLGADIPVAIWSRPAVVEGKGERVELLTAWPELDVVLVNPRVSLSTKDVFARYDTVGGGKLRRIPAPLGITRHDDAITLIKGGVNDLEPVAREMAPPIGDALDALAATDGCVLARMTGSGATCFGLYPDARSAARAAARASQARPDWWVAAARLGGCEDS